MKKKIFCISMLLIAISGYSQEVFDSNQKEKCQWESEINSFNNCNKLVLKTTISLDIDKKTISFTNPDKSVGTFFIKYTSQSMEGVSKFTVISPTDGYVFICLLDLKNKQIVFLPENSTSIYSTRLTYFLN